METTGYYAPLTPTRFFHIGAWDLTVGSTPAGEWVVEYQSAASARYQREYFATEAEAVASAEKFCRVS